VSEVLYIYNRSDAYNIWFTCGVQLFTQTSRYGNTCGI